MVTFQFKKFQHSKYRGKTYVHTAESALLRTFGLNIGQLEIWPAIIDLQYYNSAKLNVICLEPYLESGGKVRIGKGRDAGWPNPYEEQPRVMSKGDPKLPKRKLKERGTGGWGSKIEVYVEKSRRKLFLCVMSWPTRQLILPELPTRPSNTICEKPAPGSSEISLPYGEIRVIQFNEQDILFFPIFSVVGRFHIIALRAIPSSVLDNLVSNVAGPSLSEVTTTLDASSNMIQATSTSALTALPSLHFEYSREASNVSVISSEDMSVASPTVYARDGSIISVSSDSSDQTTSAVGELGYASDVTDEGPADGPVHRLTVYPRYREGGASWLVLHDYRRTLAKIGFDTHQMGEFCLPHSKIWIPYPSHLPFPVTQSNTLVFIRPVGLSTGSPNDAYDALF
ncbi:hypothetical protein B0H13DRAFT_1904486 [Mycena leptocephala]|nr:hypothetical protein B0H13DRAFT_1904486 [Mycena leptocephala]